MARPTGTPSSVARRSMASSMRVASASEILASGSVGACCATGAAAGAAASCGALAPVRPTAEASAKLANTGTGLNMSSSRLAAPREGDAPAPADYLDAQHLNCRTELVWRFGETQHPPDPWPRA